MLFRRRYRFVIILALVVIACIPVLAYLHYRWLSGIAEREQKLLQSHGTTSALRCAQTLDSLLMETQAHFAIQANIDLVDAATSRLLIREISALSLQEARQRFALWRSKPFHALVQQAWFLRNPAADEEPIDYVLLSDSDTASLPPSLPLPTAHLRTTLRDSLATYIENAPPRTRIVGKFEGLLLPIVPHKPPPNGLLRQLSGTTAYILLCFNRTYLRDSLLPGLLAQHTTLSDDMPYGAAIESPSGEVLLCTHLPSPKYLENIPTAGYSYRAAFGNVPVFPRLLLSAQRHNAPTKVPPLLNRQQRADMYAVRLYLLNTSLAAEVERAQTGNIILSFGLTVLLAAGLVILLLAAVQAKNLAEQQVRFVAGVSHELRTPLAALRAAADNLVHGVVQTPEATSEYGVMMSKEIHRLWNMIEQTLAFAGTNAQRDTGFTEDINARELAMEALHDLFMNPDAERCIVCVDIESENLMFRANRSAATTALKNILFNAVKYSLPAVYTHEIAPHAQPTVQRVHLRVSCEHTQQQSEIVFAVRDFGIGLSESDRKHIFEPFHRGRNAQAMHIRGYGLGLALVKTIMERHRGRVTLWSSPGEGSEFRLHFPRSHDAGS